MSLYEIKLLGCRPEPLASYLKALGVFRLVAQQKDPGAKGRWEKDVFTLSTSLDAARLVEFFLHEYAPTPLVAPWNGGSGFYAGDSRVGLNAIRASTHPRFAAYRTAVEAIFLWPEFQAQDPSIGAALALLQRDAARLSGKKRELVDELHDALSSPFNALLAAELPAVSPESRYSQVDALAKNSKGPIVELRKALSKVRTYMEKQKREDKERVIARARNELSEETLAWLDASLVLLPSGKAVCNPVLGTGGNEGRLDFTNNFMQRVAELLLVETPHAGMVRAALFDEVVSSLPKTSLGQFDPGRAGGYNQGQGVESKDFKANPWDFVLMLEGSLLLASAAVRRSGTGREAWGAVPFTVSSRPAGLASGVETDNARAETWLPMWPNPTSLLELAHVFAEGRSNVGRRRSADGVDFARAVATLGVDRGFDEFTRFAFLERRGKSYVALPSGRLRVTSRPELGLLEELDSILPSVDLFLRKMESVPARWAAARRAIDESILRLCQLPDTASHLQLLRCIGRLEALMAQSDAKTKKNGRPWSGLSPLWILRAGVAPEIRIAASVASIGPTGKVGPVRSNLAGTDPSAPWQWDPSASQQRWEGTSLPQRLTSVLERRLLDASRLGCKWPPFHSVLSVDSPTLIPFLYGQLDEVLLEELLFAFCWIDWRKEGAVAVSESWKRLSNPMPVPRDFALLKLLFWPGRIRDVSLKPEPRVLSLMQAGRIAEACDAAASRLRVSGLSPRAAQFGQQRSVHPDYLTASMLIPMWDLKNLERLVFKTDTEH